MSGDNISKVLFSHMWSGGKASLTLTAFWRRSGGAAPYSNCRVVSNVFPDSSASNLGDKSDCVVAERLRCPGHVVALAKAAPGTTKWASKKAGTRSYRAGLPFKRRRHLYRKRRAVTRFTTLQGLNLREKNFPSDVASCAAPGMNGAAKLFALNYFHI